MCGAIVVGFAFVAWVPQSECFECGLPQRMAEIVMTIVLIIWAIVAVIAWVWFAPRN